MRKPSDEECQDMRKLILRKLVMDHRWGGKHPNYIKMTDVPRGLTKDYPPNWYMKEVEYLKKNRILGAYKKRDTDPVYLNQGAKSIIEQIIRDP